MRIRRRVLVMACVVGLLASCSSSGSSKTGSSSSTSSSSGSSAATSVDPALAASIDKVVQDNITKRHLRAVIVRVTIDGKDVITKAYGDSLTGVPVTTDTHWRNGAIAISYVATILLQLVDEKKVSLDDKVSKFVPEIPHSDEVTLGQLAQMTSGYPDYLIGNADVAIPLYNDPFKQWTPEEILATVSSKPLLFTPGTNWSYAHTNYVILGLALEKVTGKSMPDLMQERIFGPLGLKNTSGNDGTPKIPEPALHAFTSERRGIIGVPDGAPFYEESTYWNPSITITHGAIQTTDIFDADASAIAIGTGKLISPESYKKMTAPDLRGKTTLQDNCPATCFVQNENYTYGIGVVLSGHWLTQAPLFFGQDSAIAYLPSKKVAISIACTFAPAAFDPSSGAYVPETGKNAADLVWREIGAVAAPDDAPPLKPR
jgi:CubicO group peptidase (beta-lactamase class C family)